MAAISIANVVKTSLGPVGLDKMMVDDVGVGAKHPFFDCDCMRCLARMRALDDCRAALLSYSAAHG